MKPWLVGLLIATSGCPSLAFHAHRSAPGHVDLASPPHHEAGDPAAFERASDPGEYRAMILPGGYAGIGEGRRWSATELGVQLRFTFAEAYDDSSKRDEFPFVYSAWGATVGWGVAQLDSSDTMPHATIGGPVYAEVNHTLSVGGIGAGVAVYPTRTEVGPQLSAWFGPYLFRMRYQPDSGWEVYGAFQLELPTVWTWSR